MTPSAALASIPEIDRELARLRCTDESGAPFQRTSVMTHLAWVPAEWVEAAEDVLAGLAGRHPSRTIVLVPDPGAEGGREADVEVETFSAGETRQIAVETIRLRLCGSRAAAPASIVQPLPLPALPGLPRSRGAQP